QQVDHRCGCRGEAARLRRRGNLIADVLPGGRAETLSAAIRTKEHPTMRRENGAERIEGHLAQHTAGTSMVVDHGGKRSGSIGQIQHTVQHEVPARKGYDSARALSDAGVHKRRKEYRDESQATDHACMIRDRSLHSRSTCTLHTSTHSVSS